MLFIEIADTPEKQAYGLMFRGALKDDSGMLFKFSRPQVLKFWGLNTFIPLDIAFISPKYKIVKIAHIKPLDDKNVVSSDAGCVMAIEANAGYFSSQNISVGDKIDIDKHRDFDVVYFKDEKERFSLKDVFS